MERITLKAMRVNAGLTQEEVAKALGVVVKTVANWESGETVLSAYDFIRLCNLCKFPIGSVILPCELDKN